MLFDAFERRENKFGEVAEARDALTHKLVDALKEYKLLGGARHNFGFNSLAFPESMKLLPLFAMCATKTLALKGAPRDVAG